MLLEDFEPWESASVFGRLVRQRAGQVGEAGAARLVLHLATVHTEELFLVKAGLLWEGVPAVRTSSSLVLRAAITLFNRFLAGERLERQDSLTSAARLVLNISKLDSNRDTPTTTGKTGTEKHASISLTCEEAAEINSSLDIPETSHQSEVQQQRVDISGVATKLDTDLLSLLWRLLQAPGCPTEAGLVAGAALVCLELARADSEESALLALAPRLQCASSPLARLCVGSGLLTSAPPALLLATQGELSLQSVLLDTLLQLCTGVTRLSYHSFSLLRHYWARLLDTSQQIATATQQTYQVEVAAAGVGDTVELCRAGLDSPTRGVADLCQETLGLVLSTYSLAQPQQAAALEARLVETALQLPWTQRAKYSQLSSLLRRLGLPALQAREPGMARALTASLCCPHLVHAGAGLLSLLLPLLPRPTWEAEYLPVLVDCLLSPDAGLGAATRQQWLPPSLRLVVEARPALLARLQADTQPALLARLAVLRLGGAGSGSEEVWGAVERGLQHGEANVRGAALALLDTPGDQSRPRSLLLSYLSRGEVEGGARLRQITVTAATAVWARCCGQGKVKNKNKKKVETQKISESKRQSGSQSESQLENHVWLEKCLAALLSQLLPGGNYHRRVLALDLLQALLEQFPACGSPGCKLAAYLVTDRHMQLLILLLDDHMTDVKEKAAGVLKQFRPCQARLEQLQARLASLLCSPREGDSETAALLASLLARWTSHGKEADQNQETGTEQYIIQNHKKNIDQNPGSCQDKGRSADVNAEQVEYGVTYKDQDDEVDQKPIPGQGELVPELMMQARASLACWRGDPLSGAATSPLYPVLLTIRRLLLDRDCPQFGCLDQAGLDELLNMLEQTAELMLTLLGGAEAQAGGTPDFQQMAMAVRRAVGAGEEGDEVRLVVTAAWHSLKQVCLLAGGLGAGLDLLPHPQPDSHALSLAGAERCSLLLLNLLSCRHKGVVEAVAVGAGQLAVALLATPYTALAALPATMLDTVLAGLAGAWANTSYARRAAGLPGLVTALLTGEPPCLPRSLLPRALASLVNTASGDDTPDLRAAGDAEDCPASHALHILRCMVAEACLARDLAAYLPSLASICLTAFSSHSWSVRNAGLQLWGALTPRLVGQQKVRGEGSGLNCVSLLDLECRYPALLDLLLPALLPRPDCLVPPGAVPVLTLLARLESGQGPRTDFLLAGITPLAASPVHQVRVLAARVVAQFHPGTAAELAAGLLHTWPDLSSNLQHFNIAVVSHLVTRGQTGSPASLAAALASCDATTHCFTVKAGLAEMLRGLAIQHGTPNTTAPLSGYSWEPGLATCRDLWPGTSAGQDSREAEDVAATVRGVMEGGTVQEILALLQQLVVSPHCQAHADLVYKLVSCLLSRSALPSVLRPDPAQLIRPQLVNSEEALDLLDCLDEAGAARVTGVPQLRAAALNTLLCQDDWEWFFGDSSEYCGRLVVNTEEIQRLARPGSLETERLDAANALLQYSPALQTRQLRDKAVLVLQFGFINLLNAALTLLEDEEEEVRQVAAEFACSLPKPAWAPPGGCVGRWAAVRLVVWYGLDQLHQVVEQFSPVQHTLLLPTQFSAECLPAVREPGRECELFRRGDGVNVYREGSYAVLEYFGAIQEYLQRGEDCLGMVVSPSTALAAGEAAVAVMRTESGRETGEGDVWSPGRTGEGYGQLCGVNASLHLLSTQPVTKTPLSREVQAQLAAMAGELTAGLFWWPQPPTLTSSVA